MGSLLEPYAHLEMEIVPMECNNVKSVQMDGTAFTSVLLSH